MIILAIQPALVEAGSREVACLLSEDERNWLGGKKVSGLKIKLGSKDLVANFGDQIVFLRDAQLLRLANNLSMEHGVRHCVVTVKVVEVLADVAV